jgi:acetylornithine deacetylase
VRDMGTGVNAIDKAFRVIAELRKLEEEWNAKKSDDPDFKDHPHPINLNIGKIVGGDWASSVPCWTHVDCRISILPGTHAADAAREIEQRIAAFARSDNAFANTPPKITFNGFFAEGYRLKPGSEAEATLGRAHEAVFGRPLGRGVSTAYLDARVYALYDKIPTLNYGCKGENIHGYDERVSLLSAKETTKAMALFVAEWCGTETI